jgi:transcriptional regulator with XRE-family HTH domain
MSSPSAIRPAQDLRQRRLAVGCSQLELAVRAGVAPSSLRTLEAGYRPHRSLALQAVETALDELERGEPTEYRLEPGLGRSGYRGDHNGPQPQVAA